jgi:PAS domain S-box-containing protein
MIGWLTRNRTPLAFAVAGGLLLAIGIVAFSARALVERHETVRHITQVLVALDAVLSAVVDAETDQRGLLRTGDERYLASYTESLEAVAPRLDAVRALTATDARRQQQLDGLERLVTELLDDLRETERVRRDQGPEAARQRVRASRGLFLMDEIWTRVAAMKAEERREITAQSAGHAEEAGRVFLLLSTLAGATAIVLAVLVVESRRRAGEIRTTREALQRRAAEQRRSESTSHALLEYASEGIVVSDATGAIVLVNARTEAMFGYPRAELIGQPVELLVPAPLRDRHAAHRAGYTAEPRTRPMGRGLDLAGRRKDGTEFPLEVSLSYVRTDEGLRVIAFVTDISDRIALQRAARQADKLAALGTLSAGIAHEINNPIGIITSRVEVMLLEAEEDGLPAELRKDLEVILRHARRVAAITQGLLSFARQSAGARGPMNLNQVVEEIVQLARKDMSRARVEVRLELDHAVPTIEADANAIGQVLLNLLTNARSAMPDGGAITIETSHPPGARSVRLAVRDTGSGIAPDVVPKIFDPFFTTKPDGTGLGLSISHGIVHDHHGTLEVTSEVGRGSTFTLTLPLDPSRPA